MIPLISVRAIGRRNDETSRSERTTRRAQCLACHSEGLNYDSVDFSASDWTEE